MSTIALKGEQRAAINKLLAAGKSNLRDLHNALGLDFCAPFDAWTITGSFTPNRVRKEAERRGHDCDKDLVVICTRSTDPYWRWSPGMHPATLDGNKVTLCTGNLGKLAPYYHKQDFEGLRKNSNAETVMIVQDRDLLKEAKRPVIEDGKRYELASHTSYNLSLREIDGSGRTLIVLRGDLGLWDRDLSTIPMLDKSGYLLLRRREDLKRRARELREEREKAAYRATDNSAKLAGLWTAITNKKAELARTLEAATTSEELRAVGTTLNQWDGLVDIVRGYEHLKQSEEEKTLARVEDFEDWYVNLCNKLAKL